ncbi:PEP-CTERM sorting domain-containing protein [Planctomycetota bacterium]
MRRRRIILGVLALTVAAMLSMGGAALADVFSNVPEATAEGYQLVYTLPIPNAANFRGTTVIPYTVDTSATIGYFDRVAYYLELDGEWVYASMDAFSVDRKKIGLPHSNYNPVKFQQIVNNMNVVTNVPAKATPGTGLSTGNIEMWPSNYGAGNEIGIPNASGSVHDFGDGGAGTGAGYGSFQVHNHDAAQTVLAYNRWGTGGSGTGAIDNVGIGNNDGSGTIQTSGGPRPDWTFQATANLYTTKNLQILVRPAGLPAAPANVVAKAPEASTFTVVYELPIGNGAFSPSQYTQDNAAAYVDGSFDRVAYYLELDSPAFGQQFAYVSTDAFTTQADRLGVPKSDLFQQFLSNMNVVSNVAGVVNGEGITTGNIEFWGTNYSGANGLPVPGASNTLHDFGDTPVSSGTYGSMQIHNHGAAQTIFAYNHWSGSPPDLGIGNDPNTTRGNYRPDWTFAFQTSGHGANQYTVKNLWVLAHIAGAQLTATPPSGSLLDFGDGLDANTLFTLPGAVTLQNTGTTNSIIDILGYAVTGPDAGLFDVSNFTPALLQAGFSDTIQYDVDFLGSTMGAYSALLTFTTSEGNVTYGLAADVIPEPATLSLLGLGGLFLLRRRKRAA